MPIKILAMADLHLGKRSSGLSHDTEDISTKHTWRQLVDWATQNNVDVLLLCGDIIDQDNKYFEAIGALQSGFEKLGRAGIQVYIVSGNHDFDVLPQALVGRGLGHVHLLGKNGQWELKTYSKDGQTIQFAGWSFPQRFVLEDPLVHFHAIRPDPNFPCIGLLHADVDNLKSRYAPVPLTSLQKADVDIWMLGHIHKPSDLQGINKIIQYPGSPQAMSSKEPGGHGALLLIIDNPFRVQVEAIPFSTVRYESLDINISAVVTVEELRATINNALSEDAEARSATLENVLYLIYDIRLIGQHGNEKQISLWAEPFMNGYEMPMAFGGRISVRNVTSAIRPAIDDLAMLAQQSSPAGILAETILADREGRTTPFLDELTRQWNAGFQDINSSATYQPLYGERQAGANPVNPREFIIRECTRLLSELLLQVN
jgi:exonuclease SbcD